MNSDNWKNFRGEEVQPVARTASVDEIFVHGSVRIHNKIENKEQNWEC